MRIYKDENFYNANINNLNCSNANIGNLKVNGSLNVSKSSLPNDVVYLNDVQTLTNKTISTSKNIITSASVNNSGIITTGTQTFSGIKTFASKVITNSLSINTNLEATLITVEDLIVEDSVSLPSNSIVDSYILSVSGSKINDPLQIDNIYEKTASSGIKVHDTLKLMDSSDSFSISLNTPILFNNIDLYFPALAVNPNFFVLTDEPQIIRNKTMTAASTTFNDTGKGILSFNLSSTTAGTFTQFILLSTINTNITFPNRSDTVVLLGGVQQLNSKTLASTCALIDPTMRDGAVSSKRAVFGLSNLTTTRNMTFPDESGEIVLNSAVQTLTNKTLDAPVFSGSASGTLQTSGLFYSTNTTNSTSTTSNSSIRTNGGISCGQDLYASNLFGINQLTSYYCIRANNSAVQDITSGSTERLILNTTEYNPSSMTTTFTAGNYYITINKTGKYHIVASSHAYMAVGSGTFQGLYLYNSGTILNATEYQFTSQCMMHLSWSGILSNGDQIYMEGYLNGTVGTTQWGIQSGNDYMKTRLSIHLIGI